MTMTAQTELSTPFDIKGENRSILRWIKRVPGKIIDFIGGSVDRHRQNILTAMVQIWANKARSILTTLGIIIAVASTITVVSMVQGFGNYVTDALRGFGTNMIIVIPEFPSGRHGRMMGRTLMDIHDVRAVNAKCDKIRRITPILFSTMTIEYGRENITDIDIRGVTEQFQPIRNFFVDKGRFFGPIDIEQSNKVCVLGRDVLKRLECDENIVGDYIYINQHRFLVLGLLEAKGSMIDENQDEMIVMPYTTFLGLSPFMRRFMPFVLEVVNEESVEEASLQITRILRDRHDIKPGQPNDFRILRQDELLRDFEKVQMVATSALAGIVGISLIVGGIGIMNVMLVSVTERTREIGLRKAIGGRRRDILTQFLTEAVALSTLGGVLGLFFGYAICSFASLHPSMVEINVPLWAVGLALGFSVSVGVIFGIIPAFKAAILHPIDALRHE